MITGSLGINDSMSLFLYSQIKNELGPIDVIIYKGNQENFLPFNKDIGDEFCQDTRSNLFVDGCINAYYMNGTLSFNSTPIKNPLTDISIKIIAFDFSQLTFFDIKNTKNIKFIIPENLNEKLNVSENGNLYLSEETGSLFNIGKPKFQITEFITNNNLPNLNSFSTGFESNYTIFMDISEFYNYYPNKENETNIIMISNTGDWLKGNTFTPNVVSFIKTNQLFSSGFKVDSIKMKSLQQVGNANIGYLFLFLSTFSIVSGIFLMISTYSMMAKERESELGMLRAIGYSESDIRKMFFLEGIFYTVLSTSFGIFSGIFLTKFILSRITGFVFNLSNKFLNAIGSNFLTMNEIPDFEFYISYQNVIFAFSIGIFISLIILFFYSKRTSKIGIVSAIRGIDLQNKTQHHSHLLLRALIIISSIMIIFSGIDSTKILFTSLGSTGLIFGLMFKKLKNNSLLFNFILVIMLILTILLDVDIFSSGYYALIIVLIKPLLLLSILPVLILRNLGLLKRLFLKKPFSKIIDPFIVKMAFAYPNNEKNRNRLIISVYSLVVFIIVIVTVIPHSQMIGIRKSQNTLFWGYDAFVPEFLNSNTTYKKELIKANFTKDIQEVIGFNIKTSGGQQRAFLISQDFQFYNPQGKWYSTSEYNTIDEAVKHLKENKKAYIVISGRESESNNSGSTQIQITGNNNKLGTFFFDNITFFQGILLTDKTKIQNKDINQYDLIKLTGNNVEEIKKSMDKFRTFTENKGVFTITNNDVIEISEIGIQGMIKILNAFLYFGMIIGIMGISITMYRAFYDRRKTIGMLKAIGFTKSQIFFSFLIETSIIVITGLFIGIVSGIISGEQVNSIFSQLGAPGGKILYVPWLDIILICIAFYIASIISVLIPSYNASKIKPAEALKTLE